MVAFVVVLLCVVLSFCFWDLLLLLLVIIGNGEWIILLLLLWMDCGVLNDNGLVGDDDCVLLIGIGGIGGIGWGDGVNKGIWGNIGLVLLFVVIRLGKKGERCVVVIGKDGIGKGGIGLLFVLDVLVLVCDIFGFLHGFNGIGLLLIGMGSFSLFLFLSLLCVSVMVFVCVYYMRKLG